MYDLSILIPSKDEEFISNTVENILKNKRGKTEIIVGLDGAWAEPPIAPHPDVRIIYVSEPKGQRGMTNLLCKLSQAKYVAKCDAHCAFDEGFDVKLMEAMEDNWTIVPVMKNLHAFDWVCDHCGMRYYQGEKPGNCRSEMCETDGKFHKEIIFEPRSRERTGRGTPNSRSYRFTPDQLQFKYFEAYKSFQDQEPGDIKETMSLQGSFFMLTRQKYWELNICDESWGGWGQQGTEVALKTWLSGGRVVVHTGTWYAHMFRTNGQLAFPWNGKNNVSQASQQKQARKACVDLFKYNKWEKQVRPLSWLIEKFWDGLQKETYQPDKGDRAWTEEDLAQLKSTEERFNIPIVNGNASKGILYFTDNELPLKIARPVQAKIREIAQQKGMELVSSSRKPMHNMGVNVVTEGVRGYETMFTQILAGLEAMTSDIVFMAEHDVLYPKEHFNFTPANEQTTYYDTNWWKIHPDGLAVHWDADQVSGLCAYRSLLLDYYRERVASFDRANFDRKFEPLSGLKSVQWQASVPHIDIRHGKNLTYNKKSLDDFRDKSTAVNFESSTIDKIKGWDIAILGSVIK